MINSMDKVKNNLIMETHIMVNGKITYNMVKVCINFKMEANTKVAF
jgi:hypothetical protein